MNVTFGLVPPLDEVFRGKEKGRNKKKALSARALADLDAWLGNKAEEAA
jgi:methylenetetrahydrofolate--tRNA-(uracil-5-)-methyltransferase